MKQINLRKTQFAKIDSNKDRKLKQIYFHRQNTESYQRTVSLKNKTKMVSQGIYYANTR